MPLCSGATNCFGIGLNRLLMGFIADILLGPHHILKVLLFKFNVEICGEKMNNSEFS